MNVRSSAEFLHVHNSVSMIPDDRYLDGVAIHENGENHMMCLNCGILSSRPRTWQLRGTVRVE